MTAGRRAAQRILAEKEVLARSLTDSLYAEMPWLTERYGAIGREKCLQDMRYTLEHLVPAVDLEEPDLFARYVRWLNELLRSRNVSTGEVVRTLELMERLLSGRFPPDEAAAALPALRAGLSTLAAGEPAS